MATYLITGTAKGLGLELTSQLSKLPTSQVSKIFAVTRGPPTPALSDLISQNAGRVVSIIATVDDTKSVEQAAEQVKDHLKGAGLDVLVNNAAVQKHSPNGKMEGFTPDDLSWMLNTNLVGPHRMTVAFLPLLRAGKEKKVINLSSTMGSLAWAEALHLAPGQAYKVSKCGLHMLNKMFALDLAGEGFTFLCISPGHLKTDLGGDGDFTVDIGTAEVRRMILEAKPEQTGKFLNIHVPGHEEDYGKYDGKEIAW